MALPMDSMPPNSFIDVPDAWRAQRSQWITRPDNAIAAIESVPMHTVWSELAADMQQLVFERLVYEASDALNEVDYYFAVCALYFLSMTNKETRLRSVASRMKLVHTPFTNATSRESIKATYLRSGIHCVAVATNNPLLQKYAAGVKLDAHPRRAMFSVGPSDHTIAELRAVGFNGSPQRIVSILELSRVPSVFESLVEGALLGRRDDMAWEIMEYMKRFYPKSGTTFHAIAILCGRYDVFARLNAQRTLNQFEYPAMLITAARSGQVDTLRKLLRDKHLYSLQDAILCLYSIASYPNTIRRDTLVFTVMDVLTPDSYRNEMDSSIVGFFSIAVIDRIVKEGIYKWMAPSLQTRLLELCVANKLDVPMKVLLDIVPNPEKILAAHLRKHCSLAVLDFYAFAGLFHRFKNTLAQECVDTLWPCYLVLDNGYLVLITLCEMYGATLAKLPAADDFHRVVYMLDTYPRFLLAIKHGFDMKVHIPGSHFRVLVCRYRDKDFAEFDRLIAARTYELDVHFWEHAFMYVDPNMVLEWMIRWHIDMKIPYNADELLAMAIQRDNYQLLIFLRKNMGVQVDEATLRTAIENKLGDRMTTLYPSGLPDLDSDSLTTLSSQIPEESWSTVD